MLLKVDPPNKLSQFNSSLWVGDDSKRITEYWKKSIGNLHRDGENSHKECSKRTLEEQLYDALAFCKINTSGVAMHLTDEWRNGLFLQLDSLMDLENWEDDDIPVTNASFTTFLRMITLIKPHRRPGLGSTSNGNIIAAWTNETDRLTVECLASDSVRWVLSHNVDNIRESAAGEVQLTRLKTVLVPYNQNRWFMY